MCKIEISKVLNDARNGVVCAFACVFLASHVNAQDKLYANEFPLSDITLLESPFQHARDLNIQTLLQYDTDRLLAGFRKEAGLPAKAKIFPNWEGLDGHVGGHYLSALAMNYAATKNAECERRMKYMIDELKACQEANAINNPTWGKGYIGAVPGSAKIWSALQAGNFDPFRAAWVPWYNVHKMYAGLRDAWLYTGNEDAKNLFLSFCDWGIDITSSLSGTQMQSMLDIEHGGMNEVFADAYQMTNNEKYLIAAKRFTHKMLFDAMVAHTDNLDNKHANTQVPKAIGFERVGEVSNDKNYQQAGLFFWETVTANRSIAIGGNSRREFFPSVNASMDFVNDVEGPESCNSYNMLKLTEDLFRLRPDAKYADYYEKALYNHILSTQHPDHGGYVYFTPARPRHYRVYSAPNQAMWCCVGSGMENHGKYSQFIYTRDKESLFVNLFIPSELNWKDKGVKIKQLTAFPYEEQTKFIITEGSAHFNLMVRYPGWVKNKALNITVNGKKIAVSNQPSSYVSISRQWKKGDIVTVTLPMRNTAEYLPNVHNYLAIMHGPVLLAAKTGTEDMKGLIADDGRWAHIASGKKLPIDKAPIIIENDVTDLMGKLKPVPGKPLEFSMSQVNMVNKSTLTLQPFFSLHDARYMMYWMALGKKEYQSYLDSISTIEKEKLALDKRTIDQVAPGEQQPEADHHIQQQFSNTGNYLDRFWRDARNRGFFSYEMATNKESDLNLVVTYWGNESGNRKFEIYIDGEKLVAENIAGKWSQYKFNDVVYAIPATMINGKDRVTVKFQPIAGNTAGAVYHVRIVRK